MRDANGRLMSLPNDFSYATALTRLDLSSNRLRHLPLDFGLLFSLQVTTPRKRSISSNTYGPEPPLSALSPEKRFFCLRILVNDIVFVC